MRLQVMLLQLLLWAYAQVVVVRHIWTLLLKRESSVDAITSNT